MRSVLLGFTMVLAACGSVAVKSDAAGGGGDGKQIDAVIADTPANCGAAGQQCCTNNACGTGLACTTSDMTCRTGELFFAASNSGGTGGVATVGHGDGTTFTLDMIGTGMPTAIWGTSASDVWVLVEGPDGSSGQTTWARHWNGTAWGAQVDFPVGSTGYAIWGDAADNYWAVNNAGSAMHWNGQTWAAPQTISSGVVLTQVWGTSSTDVWAMGQSKVGHWDGSGSWTVTTPTGWAGFSSLAISGRPSGDFIAGGLAQSGSTQVPAVLRRSGGTFTTEPLGDGVDCASAVGVWDGPDDAWALTAAAIQVGTCDTHPTVVHYAGGTWTAMGKLPDASSGLQLWGTSNKDLYVPGKNAAGVPGLFHYNGTAWSTPYTTPSVGFIRAVWGTGGPR